MTARAADRGPLRAPGFTDPVWLQRQLEREWAQARVNGALRLNRRRIEGDACPQLGPASSEVPLVPLSTTEYLTANPKEGRSSSVVDDGAACPRPVRAVRRQRELVTGAISDGDVINLPCNTRTCPICGPRVKRRLIGHFVGVFRTLPSVRFVTLTVDQTAAAAGGVSPAESRRLLVYYWSKLRKRLKRLDERFAFVVTFESHQSGWYHLHAICSISCAEDSFRQHAFASGFGAVMDVEALETSDEIAKRVGYCVKYLLKDAGEGEGRGRSLCSEGIGYYADAQQLRREAWNLETNEAGALAARAVKVGSFFEAQESAALGVETFVDEWEVAAGSAGRSENANTLKPGDRQKFLAVARGSRTFVYKDRTTHRGFCVVHYYDRATKAHSARWWRRLDDRSELVEGKTGVSSHHFSQTLLSSGGFSAGT